MKLSKEAQRALLAASGRIGAEVKGMSREVHTELMSEGYVSNLGHLTGRGRNERSHELRRREDEAFG